MSFAIISQTEYDSRKSSAERILDGRIDAWRQRPALPQATKSAPWVAGLLGTAAIRTSKWNKVGHRLFSFITMNWKARPLVCSRVIVDLINATTTDTGLTVCCELAETHRVCGWDSADYPKGVVVSDRELDGLNIGRNAFHGAWNYTMQPTKPLARALVSG